METVWLVKMIDTVWGDGSPGLNFEKIISVCTNEEEANRVAKEEKNKLFSDYNDIWVEIGKTNTLL